MLLAKERDAQKLSAVISLNTTCAIVALLWGLWTWQEHVIHDALTMLFDSMVFCCSLVAMNASRNPPTPAFSYGFERAEILAGFANAAFLVFHGMTVVVHSISWAAHHFGAGHHSEEHESGVGAVFPVALVMFASNMYGLSAFRLNAQKPIAHRRGRDDNLHCVYLHLLSNALAASGILFSALMHKLRFGLQYVGGIVTPIYACGVVYSAWPLFTRTARILLQTTPASLASTVDASLRQCCSVAGVERVVNTHLWFFSPGILVGTLIVSVTRDADHDHVLSRIKRIFAPIVSDLTVDLVKVS
mmetsp:Transcript_18045/g.31105  ORF Transcript_18045/g.31105 Transcript_18045/m.31105 type:complete len:302 (-) Transcript_18045:411-1316(-)